ncbi:hypothetical protein [Hymenobacter ginsengisoli]|nr:hypothetical protein [Hymenobacter sp. KCTC 23674]
MNSGTGAGANYGTSNTGTGLGNSGTTSNESTSYNAGTDYSSATGGSTSSDANTLDSTSTSPMSTTSPTTPTNSTDSTSRPGDDYSATQKGGEIAGDAGAAVGRGIDAVQNTASRAGHAVEDAATGTRDSYDGDYSKNNTTTNSMGTDSSRPGDDYSATAKGAAVAGTAGAAVGRGIDAVQNTASRAGHAVEDAATGTRDSYDGDYTHTSGIFRDRSSAEKAYQSLHERGYGKDDVNLMMSDETRKTHFGDNTAHTDLGDKAMEGAGVGSAIGGTAGAIIGAIAAIGTSVALPGLGLIIAGPLAAALAGAGAGGLTGGLVGALVGSGIPEEHAAEYEEGIKNGGIVMGVKPRNAEDAKYFEEQFRNNNADKVYRY